MFGLRTAARLQGCDRGLPGCSRGSVASGCLVCRRPLGCRDVTADSRLGGGTVLSGRSDGHARGLAEQGGCLVWLTAAGGGKHGLTPRSGRSVDIASG